MHLALVVEPLTSLDGPVRRAIAPEIDAEARCACELPAVVSRRVDASPWTLPDDDDVLVDDMVAC